MFLNSVGDIFHGVAGGSASINNSPFSKGAAGGFLNDDTCLFANGDAAWVVYLYDRLTGKKTPAVDQTSDPQFSQGANTMYAGGGVWAAWLGGTNDHRGLYTSTGFRLPDGGLLGVGPDGVLAFKPDYQSMGPSWAIDKAGQERFAAELKAGKPAMTILSELVASDIVWQLSALTAAELQLLGGRRAIWQESNRLCVVGIPKPQQIGGAWRPHAYEISGRWWVSYFSSEAGVILHPVDSFDGYVIAPPGRDCWHDGRVLANGVLRLGLSSSEAEQAGQITHRDVDFSSPTVNLQPAAPLPPLVLPAPTRPLWAGCFEFAQAPQGPGNSLLQVRNFSGTLARPAIIGAEEIGKVTGTLLGLFISGGSVEEIEAAAKASKLRPVVYWDNNNWPRWPTLPNGAWLCLRMYWQKAQPLDVFLSECRASLRTAPAGVPLVMVVQQYSSNSDQHGYVFPTTPAPQDSTVLRLLAPLFVQLANESPAVVSLMLFSGYGRRGGLMDHPDLEVAWATWSAKLRAPKVESYPPIVIDPPTPIPPTPYPPARPYEKRSA